MYTVDASVWVNGFDQRESGHATSRQFLDLLRGRAVPVVVPNLVLVEVAGAVSRTRSNATLGREFATAMIGLPNVTLMPLDDGLARQALALAAEHGLRGADAVYAAVAVQANATLISLDNQHLTRLVDVVAARTPAAALAELGPPPVTA